MQTTDPSSARPNAGVGDTGSSEAPAKTQEVAGQAQEKAQAAAGQAQAKVREQLDQRSSQVAERITEQASDLRSVSGALREQGKEGPANAADRLAGYAEKVGGSARQGLGCPASRCRGLWAPPAGSGRRRRPSAGVSRRTLLEGLEHSALRSTERRPAPATPAGCVAASRRSGWRDGRLESAGPQHRAAPVGRAAG
jgi:hypothetical protein